MAGAAALSVVASSLFAQAAITKRAATRARRFMCRSPWEVREWNERGSTKRVARPHAATTTSNES
jgi:hypothetical protein